jgi:transmembrane sensor
MSEHEPDPPRDQLLREAATWFARMRGPAAATSKADFEAWLRRGALHRQAYNRAAEIFAMGKLLAEEDGEGRGAPGPGENGEGRRRFGLIWAATGGLVAAGAAALLLLLVSPMDGPAPDRIAGNESERSEAPLLLTTAAGETRAIRLADGSLVTLEGGSMIEVRLGSNERSLYLTRGRARFQVFHEARPFVVHAGGGSVTARGTAFEVGFSLNRHVMVRLIEGTIDVAFPPSVEVGRRASTTRLSAGQTLSYSVPLERADSAPAAGATASYATPSQTRDYEVIAVADLVAASNRGSPRPIRLAQAAIGQRRVSGRFRVDDTLLLARRLALLFDLVVDDHRPEEIVLRTR